MCMGVAGLGLILPGISFASTLNFIVTGSGYTLLFDPHGSGPSELPPSYDYHAYDCRIGDKPTMPVVVFTPPPPPKIVSTPVDPNPPAIFPKPPTGGTNPPSNPPAGLPIVNPVGPGPSPDAVPLPAPSAMAGAGLAAAAIFYGLRSRRYARA
jgi:hypothetical protein